MTDQLADYSSEPMTVSVAGKEYALCRLGPGDFMAAQDHLRGKRLTQLIETIRLLPIASEDRGYAMANVAKAKITFDDMFDDIEARYFLLYRSLKRAGADKLTWDEVKNQFDPMLVHELAAITFHITGLTKPDGGEETARPTTGSGSSSTTGNAGASTSGISATSTS